MLLNPFKGTFSSRREEHLHHRPLEEPYPMPVPMPVPKVSRASDAFRVSKASQASSVPTSSTHQRPDVTALRHQIQLLDYKVHQLLKQRDALALRLSTAVAAHAPIYLLPDELLSKCFESGVTDEARKPYDPFPSEPSDPLFASRLLLVCKHWNQLACATPTLWTNISISNTDTVTKAYRKVKRSKAAPLDVTISFSSRLNGSSAGEPIMKAMEMLRPTIYRWRTFRMHVPNRVHAHAALKLCTRDRAPLLEALSIQISNAMQDDDYSSAPSHLFRDFTPRLTCCLLTAFNCEWSFGIFKGLNVLKLGGYWNGHSPSGMQMRAILEACPQLEELSLRNMTDIDPDCDELATSRGRHLPCLDLRRLQKLTFYYSGINRTTLLLACINCPALQKLEFAFLDDITPLFPLLKQQAMSVLTAMNLPIGLPLQTLHVESCFFNELKFVRLLKRIPTLSQLYLVDVEDVSANLLMELSTPPQAQLWTVPLLEHLSLEGCNATSLDWNALSTLVESRIPSETMHRQARSVASVSAALQEKRGFMGGDLGPPKRLRVLDLNRCNQFNREQLQWLRMYVHDVRWEAPKANSVWGSP